MPDPSRLLRTLGIKLFLLATTPFFFGHVYPQALNVPPRNIADQEGTQIITSITGLALHERELYILNEVMKGQ